MQSPYDHKDTDFVALSPGDAKDPIWQISKHTIQEDEKNAPILLQIEAENTEGADKI